MSVPGSSSPSAVPLAVERAARWQVVLAALTWPTLAVGVFTGLAVLFLRVMHQPIFAGAFALPGAAALCAAAGLLPALLLTGARRRVAEAMEADLVQRQQRAANVARAAHGETPQALFSGDVDPDLLQQEERGRVMRLAGWPQAVVALPLAAGAIALGVFAWPVAGAVPGGIGVGITLLALAFPVLVIERRLALVGGGAPATSELPEAAGLARLVRLLVWALVVGGASEIARALGASVVLYALWVMTGLVIVVAAELALRLSVAPFLPVAALAEARGLGDSALAGLLLPRLGAGGGNGTELKERFGIDLSQSWALSFVRAAALPLILALLLFGWLLSGVTTLSLQERGVYERLGSPISVFKSGLHVHLPWPFGVVRRLEVGAVHELAVGLEAGGEDAKVPARLAADTLDTRLVDRLWSSKHAADALYLVPSLDPMSNTRSAQVLGSDVRVFYRIGLDDASARAALYGLAQPQDTVRTAARRHLSRVFATRPLMAAIGEDREQLSAAVRRALQDDLNANGSGLEIIAVTIDSIHPPVEAAAAYHGVQEATIIAAREVADAHRNATITKSDKTIEAILARANGEWKAASRVAEANAESTLRSAEAVAFRTAPKALALERWLAALATGLRRSQLDIIDHRLQLVDGTVLDMRNFFPEPESNE